MGKPEGKMSILDAAELILREKGKALHPKEIIKEALKRSLIKTKGKTPFATLYSEMYVENKRRKKRHCSIRFQKTSDHKLLLVKEIGTGSF